VIGTTKKARREGLEMTDISEQSMSVHIGTRMILSSWHPKQKNILPAGYILW
jgi:hypothetical protein